MGIPVGAGTDATRVASYNPFVSLYWLVTGKTIGGLALYPAANRQSRMAAFRLWTVGSSWFSYAAEAPPVLPEWSPLRTYGGYARPAMVAVLTRSRTSNVHAHGRADSPTGADNGFGCLCWAF